MESPAAALGIYLFQAGRESGWPGIAARNSSEEAQIAALKGRFFVRVNNFEGGAGSKPAMIALATAFLAGVAADPLADPFIALPAPGRVPGSERLIRGPVGLQPYYTFGEGDILGLGGKIFAVLADYRDDAGLTSTRLLIDYKDPEAASTVFECLRSNLDPYLKIIETRPLSFIFQDHLQKYGSAALADGRIEIRIKSSRKPPAALRPLSAF
jgi:CO/xanthine dehydrogenase Mo-binding subunit